MQLAQIQEEIDVRAPLWLSHEQWAEFELFPHFMSHVVSVERQDDAPALLTAEVDGTHRTIETTIEEQRPDRLIRWDCSDGLESHGQLLFDSLEPELTRITVDVIWDPREPSEHTVSLFRLEPTSVREDLERFRDFAEKRHEERKKARAHQDDAHPLTGPLLLKETMREPALVGEVSTRLSGDDFPKDPSGTLPYGVGFASQDTPGEDRPQMSIVL